MRRILVITLAIAIAAAALTTGTVAFDMTHGMAPYGAMPCADATCAAAPMPHDMDPLDCLAHCLRAAAPVVGKGAPVAAVSVIIAALLVAALRRVPHDVFAAAATDFVAAFVRKRAVATVILRN